MFMCVCVLHDVAHLGVLLGKLKEQANTEWQRGSESFAREHGHPLDSFWRGYEPGYAWWKFVTSRIPARWHPLPHVLFGTTVWGLSGASPLGLRPPALWSGLRWGASAAAPVVLAVAVGTAIPAVREGMAVQKLPTPVSHWLLVRIIRFVASCNL